MNYAPRATAQIRGVGEVHARRLAGSEDGLRLVGQSILELVVEVIGSRVRKVPVAAFVVVIVVIVVRAITRQVRVLVAVPRVTHHHRVTVQRQVHRSHAELERETGDHEPRGSGRSADRSVASFHGLLHRWPQASKEGGGTRIRTGE